MKFLIPLTLLVAAGVSAQDKDCLADYIVTRCLSSEEAKASSTVKDCKSNDYDCLCAAYESVATCYNNCPNDRRAPDARHQVTNFCQNASLFGTRARASKTAASAASQSTNNAAMTTSDSSATNDAASTTVSSTSRPSSTGAAEVLSANAGGLLMAVAGAVAALL